MPVIACERCGSTNLVEEKAFWICKYCGSKTIKSEIVVKELASKNFAKNNSPHEHSEIDLVSDIDALLLKCKTDRKNARKYANLILDIDPDNIEALKYL